MVPPEPGITRTVLVVDDNRRLLAFIGDALTELGGYTVVTAEDGIKGLELYFALRPDCMVIDVKMPGLDGFQLVRALRGDPASASTPLIILTAMAQGRDRLAGLLAGVDQYLLKPVDPMELVTAIQQAITLGDDERRRRLRQLADEGA
ncbi:MAG: response regulator transcription factor [Ktedonobacterales bacterium]